MPRYAVKTARALIRDAPEPEAPAPAWARLELVRKPRTLYEKVWDSHVVTHEPGAPAVLYIDLHLVHEVTSPQAFQGLRD